MFEVMIKTYETDHRGYMRITLTLTHSNCRSGTVYCGQGEWMSTSWRAYASALEALGRETLANEPRDQRVVG